MTRKKIISENRKLLKKKNVHEFRKQKLEPYRKFTEFTESHQYYALMA